MSILIRDAQEGDADGIAHAHVRGWRESYKDYLSAGVLAGLSVEERPDGDGNGLSVRTDSTSLT